MTAPPTGSVRSRALAIIILLLAVLCIALLVVRPLWRARAALDQEIAATEQVRSRFFQSSAAATRRAVDPALIRAPTPAVAAAELQTALELLIQDAGGRVERLEARIPALPRRGGRRLEEVEAVAAFRASIDQLRRLLLALDEDPLVMAVDGLTIRAGSGTDGALDVELVVRGFRQRGAAR